MQRLLIVYSHPKEQSFCGAIRDEIKKEAIEKGLKVEIRDLYRLGFNSDLIEQEFISLRQDAKIEQEHLAKSDIVAFVFPIWWQNSPANLKGYFDRVFAKNFAYKDNPIEGEKSIGLLKGKKFLFFTTIGNTVADYKELGFSDAITLLYKKGIVEFCGGDFVCHKYFGAVSDATDEQRKQMLDDTKLIIKNLLEGKDG